MCGIIYALRLDGHSAVKLVKKQYERQKQRGKEGFGYVTTKDRLITDYCRATTEGKIMEELGNRKKEQVSEVMFHHRFPTSTPNFHEAAHPIWVSHESLKYDYFVVHNGVIWNDETFKEEHDRLGFKYQTLLQQQWVGREGVITTEEKWNDSEVFAIELARDLDKGGTGVKVRGSIAFICMQAEKSTGKTVKLFFGRNTSNPLKYLHTEGKYIQIASELAGTECKPDHLYVLNYDTMKITEDFYCIGYGYASNNYGYKTDHYSPKPDTKLLDEAKDTKQEVLPIEESDIDARLDALEALEEQDSILIAMDDEAEARQYEILLEELIILESDLPSIVDEVEKVITIERIQFLDKEITKYDERYIKTKLQRAISE